MTYVIVIAGQSNAQGCDRTGPIIDTDRIKTWDPIKNEWGSSNRTEEPWSYATPDGNWQSNNIALGRAKYILDTTDQPVYIIYDALGNISIDEWTEDGVSSPRYAALQQKITDAFATRELRGVAYIDDFIWSQGAYDWDNTFKKHFNKLEQLFDTQLGNEIWFSPLTTALYLIGYHETFDKHAFPAAAAYFTLINEYRCKYLPGREWETVAEGDIHYSGDELWNIGYSRIANAVNRVI